MDLLPLDVIVADDGLASLVAGYLLASNGRSVGIVEPASPIGTTAVSVVATPGLAPLSTLVASAPVVGRRSAVVLQPEGGLRIEMASDRYLDAAHSLAIVNRAAVSLALLEALRDLGAIWLSASSRLVVGPSGAVVGVREPGVELRQGRCSIINPVDMDRLFGMRPESPEQPPASLEAEWSFLMDADTVSARFNVSDMTAAEWWLYGDPFDGASGVGRIRAFGRRVTLAALVPLGGVFDRGVVVADLGERLRSHPFIEPLLSGAQLEGVSALTVESGPPSAPKVVGDGWVVGPRAHHAAVAPLTVAIDSGGSMAWVIELSLAARSVTAARLATLPTLLDRIAKTTATIPVGPIDAWADDLIIDPVGLVDGLRWLADRFPGAR